MISSFSGEDLKGWFSSSFATNATEIVVLKGSKLYFGIEGPLKGADPVDPSVALVNPVGYRGAANVVCDDKL